MFVTLFTSHLERSPLNFDDWNMYGMSVTLDTSQSPIKPFGPLVQSLACFKHSAIASLSCCTDDGLKTIEWALRLGLGFGLDNHSGRGRGVRGNGGAGEGLGLAVRVVRIRSYGERLKAES